MTNHHYQSIKHISNIHNHTQRVLFVQRYCMWTGHEYLKSILSTYTYQPDFWLYIVLESVFFLCAMKVFYILLLSGLMEVVVMSFTLSEA